MSSLAKVEAPLDTLDSQLCRQRAGVAGRTVCGRIARSERRLDVRIATGVELMRRPLRAGATALAPGLRPQIIDTRPQDSAVTRTARISAHEMTQSGRPRDVAGLEFDLLHPHSGAAMRLENDAVDGCVIMPVLPGLLLVWGT